MARILTLTLNPALDLTVDLDVLRPGHVNRSQGQLTHAAGKGLNVAQVLADLGNSVTVAGFLGRDNLAPFESLIDWRGFADGFVRVPGETRSNIKLVEATGRVTDINGQGPEVDQAAQIALSRRLEQLAPGHDAVVVAGSLPRGIDLEWFRQLLLQLRGQGLKVILDSSGQALRVGLDTAPWLVKPNVEELAEVHGGPLDGPVAQHKAARQLLERGIEHVVLSRGEEGVSWFTAGAAWHARPPKVHVASTVGAGDSLVAGMVHGLLAGEAAGQTLRRATAIAAQAVTQVGFGIRDQQQLERLQAGVQLTEQQEGCR
ncbi:1-phosphofructokinase [Pseudomonas fulva]|nr:1-phosphofructokinase [Pseudomonas fulva]MBF8779503.1 1-phosphofructokinase [Pseudomonas fulva]